MSAAVPPDAELVEETTQLALEEKGHLKKSIKGSYSATTDAPDCPASAQKATTFNLKFAGLVYGG